MIVINSYRFPVAGGSFDSDAQAFFTAASITDETFKTAYSNFVTAAKADSYYSKIFALFPYAGNATQNAYDAITATSKITFSGTWTHSNGIDPDGSSAYANSGIAPNAIGQNALGIFSYAMESWGVGDTDDMLMGCRNGSNVNTYMYNDGSNVHYCLNTSGSHQVGVPATKTGFYAYLRLSSTNIRVYKDTTQLVDNLATNSVAPISLNLYIGANNNNGSVTNNSSTKQGATGILNGFTGTDWVNFVGDFQTFLTAIGR